MAAVVVVRILGDDMQFKKTLASSRGAAAAWNKSIKSMASAGSAMTTVGRNMTHAITLPVLAIGAASVKMAYDFDKSMTRVNTLVGVSTKQTDSWRKSLLTMASETGQAPVDLANALYFITSSGVSASKALDVLRVSAKASSIGLGDTQTLADYATTAVANYGEANMSAAKAMDILTIAVKDGKGEPAEYAQYLGKLMSVAQGLNIPLSDVEGTLSALSLTQKGLGPASTNLRQLFTTLTHPAAGAAKALAGLGTSGKQLRDDIANKGLLPTLTHLNDMIKKTTDPAATLRDIFRNNWAAAAFTQLTGPNAAKAASMVKDTADAAGATDQAFKDWSQTTQGKLHIAMATLKADLTDLGGKALPKLADLFDRITKKFHELTPEQKKSLEKWALILAAIGPVALIFGKILTSLALLVKNPGIIAVGVLAASLLKVHTNGDSANSTLGSTADALGGISNWMSAHKTVIGDLAKLAAYAYLARKAFLVLGGSVAAFGRVFAIAGLETGGAVIAGFAGIAAAAVAIGVAVILAFSYCYKAFDTFHYAVNTLVNVVLHTFADMASGILNAFELVMHGLGKLPGPLGAPFRAAEAEIKKAADAVDGFKNRIDNAFPKTKAMDIQIHVDNGLYNTAVAKLNALNSIGPHTVAQRFDAVNAAHSAGEHVSGARATGGPVAGGNTYLVGEHGPELVTMGQSGFVSNATATAKMFGSIGKVSDSTVGLQKTSKTQKTQYDNAARRYHQLLNRPQRTQAQKDAVVNAKATMDQQKKDYDAAAKAVVAAQKADKALQAQYKKGAPLLTKAAALVGFADVVGPVEKQANALAAAIQKQFADKDGNIPAAAQASIDRLNDLASKAASARSGLISSLTGDSDFVTQLQGGNTNTAGIQAFLTGQVNKIKALGNDLKILSARGLPPSMLAQLAAGGLAALPIADALASASSADLAGIVNTQSQINTLTNALGDSTQSAIFGAPDSPTGNLKGTVIKDAPAGTVNNINITAQTNATAAQIAADAAWHLRTVSA